MSEVRTSFKVATAAAVLLSAVACGTEGVSSSPTPQASPTHEQPQLSASQRACLPSQRHNLPTPTNAKSVKDTRGEKVYPCMYLLDMGIPYGKPTKLLKIRPATVESSSFHAKGSLGGWAILGTGKLGGKLEAGGSSESKDVYKMRMLDDNGEVLNLTLDQDSIHIKPCVSEDVCEPSLKIEVSDKSLFTKKKKFGWNKDDNNSIWTTPGLKNGVKDDERRLDVVSQVSNRLPHESSDTSVYGGPKSLAKLSRRLLNALL